MNSHFVKILVIVAIATFLKVEATYSNPARIVVNSFSSTPSSKGNYKLYYIKGLINNYNSCIVIKSSSAIRVITDQNNYLKSINNFNYTCMLEEGIPVFYVNAALKIVPLKSQSDRKITNCLDADTISAEIPLVKYPSRDSQ